MSPYGQLYNACYVREGKPRSITFFAVDLVAALRFEEIIERMAKVKVLTLKAIGGSRFENRGGRTQLKEMQA